MKNTKTKRMLAVAALLAVGLALMLYYAAHKQGYHVDELYTYELANYPGGFYALEDGYMDSWHDGSFYSAVLTPGRLFDYTIPWNNQKIDVHPPLYYCLIYTAESLFPQLGLPWVGLLPNFVCILAGAAGLSQRRVSVGFRKSNLLALCRANWRASGEPSRPPARAPANFDCCWTPALPPREADFRACRAAGMTEHQESALAARRFARPLFALASTIASIMAGCATPGFQLEPLFRHLSARP